MSFRSRRPLAVSALALAVAACASTQKPAPEPTLASGTPGPALLQWSGSFQAVQQQNGNATAPRGRNNASGSVLLIASTKSSLRARIMLNSSASSQYVHWAMVAGRCGSSALPLLTINQFPDISLSNGRGQLDAEVPLALPTTGSYHIDVFWTNGQDQSDVMTCANLRVEPRSQS